MKEADKKLLKEIAHLSRLIQKKEKTKHAEKAYGSFRPPAKYNPAARPANKFKFFKPTGAVTVTTNEFKKPSTSGNIKLDKSTNSNFSNYTPVPVTSSVSAREFHSPSKIATTTSSLVSQNSNVGSGNNVTIASTSLAGKIFINPKIFTTHASSTIARSSSSSSTSSKTVFVSGKQPVRHVVPMQNDNMQVTILNPGAQVNIFASPYRLTKTSSHQATEVSREVTGVPSDSNSETNVIKYNIERNIVKSHILDNISKTLPISVNHPTKRLTYSVAGLSTSNPYRLVSQKSVKNVASTSTSEAQSAVKPAERLTISYKAKPVNVQPTSKNKYKLDRRLKISRPSYSSRKTFPKKFKEYESKTANRKYIVTRHSLRKLKESPKRIGRKSSSVPIRTTKYTGSSKFVKLQGTTYESKNKGKTLKRIRTSSTSLSQLYVKLEAKALQTPVTKLASRVLKKSKTTLIRNRQKKNVFCKFYNMFGVCKKRVDGSCQFVHDDRQVSICSKFIVGKCDNAKCTLSHNLEKGKIPLCRFFNDGNCSRNNCPYSHVISKRKSQLKKLKLTSTTDGSVKPKQKLDNKVVAACKPKPLVEVKAGVPNSDAKKAVQNGENSRYYQRLPNTDPVKCIIPRRLPPSLSAKAQDSDSTSDSESSKWGVLML